MSVATSTRRLAREHCSVCDFLKIIVTYIWLLFVALVYTADAYLNLNDVIIPNHGYMAISDIGSTDDTALICYTNHSPPDNATHSGGDWFSPEQTVVDFSGNSVPGFRRNRAPMIVRLLRNTATDPPSEGIYYCLITTVEETSLPLVYVGLYNSGGGECMQKVCIPLKCIIFCIFQGNITISDGMTFTVDSDLNGANPQFTLTCISTGGPATALTWTRDSDTVTEGTETLLDYGVTAQYTHTLTVTERLGGLYACTVANDKPSNDSAQCARYT